MANRARNVELAYIKHSKTSASLDCPFCNPDQPSEKYTDFEHFRVVENRFPYAIWDDQHVLKHLMLVPKRHVDKISDFTAIEAKEFSELIGRYSSQGFSIYARAHSNTSKTIVHQHTHLLLMDNEKLTSTFWVKKPYILLHR